MSRRFVVLLLAIAAGAAATVAGVAVLVLDGEEPLSEHVYIARVDTVCRELNAKLADIPAPSIGNPAAISRSIAQALPLVEERVRRVQAIEPPPELRPQAEAMFAASNRALQELRRAKRLDDADDLRGSATALGAFLFHRDEAHRISLNLGLVC
jgi:hypothetical protein